MNSEQFQDTIKITGKINEVYAITKIERKFQNLQDNPIEIEIVYPISYFDYLSKFYITIGNKRILSKVHSQEKAKEKYSDAIASNNTAVYLYRENEDVQKLHVGNLSPKEIISFEFEFVQMISSEDMSYRYFFLQKYPRIETKNRSYYMTTNQSASIQVNLEINVKGKLTRLVTNKKDCLGTLTHKYENDYSKAIITIHNDNLQFTNTNPKLLRILFRTTNINEPKLYSQYNPTMDETSYTLNYLFSSKKVEIPLLDKPDEEEDISYYYKYQYNNDEDINSPGLFVFLIDQSGSMSGEPMKILREALKIFFQSLPIGSYFQLIGFGSTFKLYNKNPEEYNSKNIKEMMKIINDLKADLGGTKLFLPLNSILITDKNKYKKITLRKNLFILTDGCTDEKSQCIQLINENVENDFQIQMFGIGKDFDRDLLEKCCIVGDRSFYFIEELNVVNKTIIRALKLSMREYFIEGVFESNIESKCKHQIFKKHNFIFQDNLINYSFICKGKPINKEKNIVFKAKNINTKKERKDKFSIKEDATISDGDELSKIIIGKIINGTSIKEKEEIKLAKEYQVLSKNTAMFGEIEIIDQNNNVIMKEEKIIQQEMKKVSVDKKNNNYDYDLLTIQAPQNIIGYIPKTSSSMESIKNKIGSFFSGLFTSSSKKENTGFECYCEPQLESRCVDACPDFDDDLKFGCNIDYDGECYDEECDMEPCDNRANYLSNQGNISQKKEELKKDHFQDLILSQDAIEGYWTENEYTKDIINDNMKIVHDKAKQYIDKFNLGKDISIKLLYTFIVIYYVLTKKQDSIEEVSLILSKGKNFIKLNGLNYNEIVTNVLDK